MEQALHQARPLPGSYSRLDTSGKVEHRGVQAMCIYVCAAYRQPLALLLRHHRLARWVSARVPAAAVGRSRHGCSAWWRGYRCQLIAHSLSNLPAGVLLAMDTRGSHFLQPPRDRGVN